MSANDSINAGPARSGSNTALVILDMISDFTFEDGEKLYPHALEAAEHLSHLKARAAENNVPVIFVNDNFGKWSKEFSSYVKSVHDNSEKGRKIIDLLKPHDGDYYILKPQRSGFYATALGVLLLSLNVSDIIFAGATTDICVLFTAHDAYMRGFRIHVAPDCTAAVEKSHHVEALEFLKRVADAIVRPSTEIVFERQTVKNELDGNERENAQTAGSEF